MARRRVKIGRSRMSCSSMKTVPRGGSNNLGNSEIKVDLPDPVGPTSAKVCPGSTVADTPCSTGCPL